MTQDAMALPTTRSGLRWRELYWLVNLRLAIGLTIVLILAVGSLVLPLFNTVDPSVQASYWKNLPPSFKHLLGTNAVGLALLWMAALLTLYTGYDYLKAGVRHAIDA